MKKKQISPVVPGVESSEEAPLWDDNDKSGGRKKFLRLRWVGVALVTLYVIAASFQLFRPINPAYHYTTSEAVAVVPAGEFATSFVKDWYTTSGGVNDWTNRLKAYNPQFNAGSAEESESRIEETNLFAFEEVEGKEGVSKATVQVRAAGNPVPFYVSLFVGEKDGSFAILSMPTIVQAPTLAAWESAPSVQVEADTEIIEALREQTEGFFRLWPTGGQGFDLVMAQGAAIVPLANGVRFSEFEQFDVHALPIDETGAVLPTADASVRQVSVTAIWQLPKSGLGVKSDYLVTIVQESGKWYVKNVEASVFNNFMIPSEESSIGSSVNPPESLESERQPSVTDSGSTATQELEETKEKD